MSRNFAWTIARAAGNPIAADIEPREQDAGKSEIPFIQLESPLSAVAKTHTEAPRTMQNSLEVVENALTRSRGINSRLRREYDKQIETEERRAIVEEIGATFDEEEQEKAQRTFDDHIATHEEPLVLFDMEQRKPDTDDLFNSWYVLELKELEEALRRGEMDQQTIKIYNTRLAYIKKQLRKRGA
jgi:hypothetical protein